MKHTPSPLFSKVLTAVETKQLNGEFTSKTEALNYANNLLMQKEKTGRLPVDLLEA